MSGLAETFAERFARKLVRRLAFSDPGHESETNAGAFGCSGFFGLVELTHTAEKRMAGGDAENTEDSHSAILRVSAWIEFLDGAATLTFAANGGHD